MVLPPMLQNTNTVELMKVRLIVIMIACFFPAAHGLYRVHGLPLLAFLFPSLCNCHNVPKGHLVCRVDSFLCRLYSAAWSNWASLTTKTRSGCKQSDCHICLSEHTRMAQHRVLTKCPHCCLLTTRTRKMSAMKTCLTLGWIGNWIFPVSQFIHCKLDAPQI